MSINKLNTHKMDDMKFVKVGYQDRPDEMQEMATKAMSQNDAYKKGGSVGCKKYAAGGVAKIRLGQFGKQESKMKK